MNSFGHIPPFEDRDITLFESRAITGYVAEKFKETGYDLITYENSKEAAFVKAEQQATNKYLAAEFYSLADLRHYPYTFYFMKTPWSSLVNDRPHVKAWWEEISARPASIKVAEGMKIIGELESNTDVI
ncbi:hypothetical protein TB1_030644 [Malus domestica]